MARYLYQGIFRDKFGHIVPTGTVSVFLKGTTTPAGIYRAETGGVAVNSVTSNTDGTFVFYVDEDEYLTSQHFKIVLSKTGFQSSTYDDITVLRTLTDVEISTAGRTFIAAGSVAAERAILGVTSTLVYKGGINCSANPNYPAADSGHIYMVSVAGKIGGGSGTTVGVGDQMVCMVDSSPAGTQAAVGANWTVYASNITIDTDGTLAANSDAVVASQKATKTYADTKATKGVNSDITSLSLDPITGHYNAIYSAASNNQALYILQSYAGGAGSGYGNSLLRLDNRGNNDFLSFDSNGTNKFSVNKDGQANLNDLITKSPWADVRAYGATTSALRAGLQAAHDALPAGGGMIFIPSGSWTSDSTTISITKPVMIVGMGFGQTIITSSASTFLSSTAVGRLIFRDFALMLTTSATGIVLTPETEVQNCCIFDKLYISDGAIGISVVKNSLQGKIIDSAILGQTTAGISLQNTVNGDRGDWVISNNQIEPGSGGKGIWQRVGGLRIIGNKIIGGGTVGYHGDSLPASSGLEIIGNSFGGFTQVQILIDGTSSYAGIQIIGNELGGSGLPRAIQLAPTGGGHLYRVTIIGNTIQDSVDVAIDLSNVTNGIVSGNSMCCNLDPGDIFFQGAGLTNVLVSDNQWSAMNSPYVGTTMLVRDMCGMTLAQLGAGAGGALFGLDGSTVMCSNCALTTNMGIATVDGTFGVMATRLAGTWRCQ
jgi:hypothetical protein